MKVTCPHCKNEPDLYFYFYDVTIRKLENPIYLNTSYEAFCRGKSICPFCGQEIHEYFSREVSKDTIIKLATGEKDK